MLDILKIEWMKLKNYRVFQVFSILYLLGTCLIVYVFYNMYREFNEAYTGRQDSGLDVLNLLDKDNIWYSVTFWTSFLIYFPGLVFILLITNEVNFKTHRQNIIDGWRRSDFIVGKILVAAALALATVIINIIAMLVMCALAKQSFTMNFKVIGLHFILSLTYFLFALVLAIWLRKSGVAIIVFIMFGLILEIVLVSMIKNYTNSGVENFLPLQIADSLIPFPIFRDNLYKNRPSLYIGVTVTLIYCALYSFFAIRKYVKDDL